MGEGQGIRLGPGHLMFPSTGSGAGSLGKLYPQRPQNTKLTQIVKLNYIKETTNYSLNTRPTASCEKNNNLLRKEKQEHRKTF